MSRKARKKLGTDMPKNDTNDSARSRIVPRRSATMMPIGMASAHVNTMLATARITVLSARLSISSQHADSIRDRHPEVEMDDPPEPAAVAHRQRLPVAELDLHLAHQVGRDAKDSC